MPSIDIARTAPLYGAPVLTLTAGELGEQHIGQLVHFQFVMEHSTLETLVTGELREVSHDIHSDSSGTTHAVTLWVTGRYNQSGDKAEFQLDGSEIVIIVKG